MEDALTSKRLCESETFELARQGDGTPRQRLSVVKTNSDSTVAGVDLAGGFQGDEIHGFLSSTTSAPTTTSSSSNYHEIEDDGSTGSPVEGRGQGSEESFRDASNDPNQGQVEPVRMGLDMNRSDAHFTTPGKARSKDEGKNIFGVWKVGRTIGRGSSGTVKLVRHLPTGQICVVKCVRRQTERSDGSKVERNKDGVSYREHFLIREALMGVLLDHPNIIRMHSYVMGVKHFYFFFEYVPGKDLADLVASHGRLSERRTRQIFHQILSAIDYAHRSFVVHRDIKLENIRIHPDNTVKVLDFGFATFHSDRFKQHSSCGSPCYAAPEIYAQKAYHGPEVDIWSLGVCLYGMVVGSLPFDKTSFRELSQEICLDVKDLIESMLRVRPEQRATMKYVLEHPWVNKISLPMDISAPLIDDFLPATNQKWVENLLRMPKHERGEMILRELDRLAQSRCTDMETDWRKDVEEKRLKQKEEDAARRSTARAETPRDRMFRGSIHQSPSIAPPSQSRRSIMVSKEVFWNHVQSKMAATEASFKESIQKFRRMFSSIAHNDHIDVSPRVAGFGRESFIPEPPPLPFNTDVGSNSPRKIAYEEGASPQRRYGHTFHTDNPENPLIDEVDKDLASRADAELKSKSHTKRPKWLRRVFKDERWHLKWLRRHVEVEDVLLDVSLLPEPQINKDEDSMPASVEQNAANEISTIQPEENVEKEEEDEDDHSFVALRSSFGYEKLVRNKINQMVRKLTLR
ncbi:serine/threonine-protein kinase KIN2 [Phlyctochytrium planicorne]|nr:serine/threonine-protein kinase KIN2 [Phlyctochytrium planicorne]